MADGSEVAGAVGVRARALVMAMWRERDWATADSDWAVARAAWEGSCDGRAGRGCEGSCDGVDTLMEEGGGAGCAVRGRASIGPRRRSMAEPEDPWRKIQSSHSEGVPRVRTGQAGLIAVGR